MILTEGSFRGMAALGDMKTFSGEAQRSVQYVRTPHAVPVTRPSTYTRAQVLAKIANLPDFDPQAGLNGDCTSAEAEIRAFHNSIYASLTPGDIDTLRNARRRAIRGVSDESIEEHTELSGVLLNLVNVLDLYHDYRPR